MEENKSSEKKPLIGYQIYEKKDIPIRILDALIIGVFGVIIALILIFAINGGYYVQFETYGGNEIEKQKLNYGKYVAEPEIPIKPGYIFQHWVTSEDESLAKVWNFEEDKVEGDLVLYAIWEAAEITVKFDLNGGNIQGNAKIEDRKIAFQEPYGDLPIPEKENATFVGWTCDGVIVETDTPVTINATHILTAVWE